MQLLPLDLEISRYLETKPDLCSMGINYTFKRSHTWRLATQLSLNFSWNTNWSSGYSYYFPWGKWQVHRADSITAHSCWGLPNFTLAQTPTPNLPSSNPALIALTTHAKVWDRKPVKFCILKKKQKSNLHPSLSARVLLTSSIFLFHSFLNRFLSCLTTFIYKDKLAHLHDYDQCRLWCTGAVYPSILDSGG